MKKLDQKGVAKTALVIVIIVLVAIAAFGVWYIAAPPVPEPVEVTGLDVKALWYEEDPGARFGWSPWSVNPGESANIYVDVTNRTGTSQTYTLELKVAGEVFDTRTLELAPREKKTEKFTYTTRPAENWKYIVDAAGVRGSIIAGNPPIIVVVSDIGGRGDLSFNDMAFKGGEEAEERYGYHMIELISMTEADYIPNLRAAATHPRSELIVGVGFLLSGSLVTVAKEFPDKNFAGIDTYSRFIEPLPNMLDIVYEEHKGSALVGALGALLAAEYGKPHIGGVFGIEIPVLWKFEIGYKWGAKWALEEWLPANKPEKKIDYTKEFVLWDYTGTFSDVAKGYEYSKPMYEKDAVTVYNIAGPLGLGINRAVKEIAEDEGLEMGPPFWTGVDANQDWINPGFIIASMMKRVDFGVTYAAKLVREGKFRDVVEEMGGAITLGIGTEVLGVPMEGISVSTLADLDEFIEMGVRAEQVLGKKVLPMPKDEIKAKVEAMREAQPSWIWEAVAELERKIRTGEPIADLDGDGTPETVPLVETDELIEYWRGILG
jgi:basic membrane protein A